MKKFIFFFSWIFFIISCGSQEKPPSGFGELDGHVYLNNESNPVQGLGIRVSGNILDFTDSEGYFHLYKVPEGVHLLEVLYQMNPIQSGNIGIKSDEIKTIALFLKQIKKDLPDFSVVDISKEPNSKWDYWIVGKQEYFYIEEENSKPKSVFYHSFKENKDYGIYFDSKGLPNKVIADQYIFLFDNFKGNQLDLGVLYPSGEFEIAREIKTDFVWPDSPKSSKAYESFQSPQSKADFIRGTGRIIGAIPCVTSGAAALISGGFAIPLALWTCGNYFVSMANNFFEDANVENGFTEFVDTYHIAGTVYSCTNPDISSCLSSLAKAGLEKYADYVEEIEFREEDIVKLEKALANNTPLKQIILQPGSEGKDAQISLMGFSNPCRESYDNYPNDSLIWVVNEVDGCKKQIDRMFIQFSISYIPVNAIISSAQIELYGYSSINIQNSRPSLSLYEVKDSWGENNINWTNQPQVGLIETKEFEKYDGENYWSSWDITNIVQDWVSGRKNNYGLGIFAGKNHVWGKLFSSDHSNSTKRPKLIIFYY